jgi:hypothetical protein
MECVTLKISDFSGSYGFFCCPLCRGKGLFKMTASSGWCENCKAFFSYFGGRHLSTGGSMVAMDTQVER